MGSLFRRSLLLRRSLSPPSRHEDSNVQETEDEELKTAFDNWKSKTYSLTVPLRIVSLQGLIPQSWIKDFMRLQGRRLKLHTNFYGSLEGIFSQLSIPFTKPKGKSTSVVAADLVSVGDS
ncbi:hypothetical protein Ddye_000551 [Dipteronia dyeriana]|uniref:Uncharacterized protein n=1 Tax=Dipteronia dyeriana TaxID=168575 RepID=A0AAE0CSN0_9ROSI|nr:hypothetical protein Ddye_000551 [Dipteronia dyeriana]